MKTKNTVSLLGKAVKMLPLFAATVAVIYAGVLLRDVSFPTVLPVNDIHVTGELHFLDKEKIKAAVKNNVAGGYFTVDLNRIREMLQQEPWIKSVALRRQWPASLNVLINEQKPVAYWNNKAYINQSGEVFKPEVIDKNLNLPTLSGPEGRHDNVWKFMNVLYREMALLEYEVVSLELDDRRAWQLVISGPDLDNNSRIDVRLGRFDTEKRLKRFIHVLPALTSGFEQGETRLLAKNIRSIDMRYPNGFAVQLKQQEETRSSYFLYNQNNSHSFVAEHAYAEAQMSEA